MEKLDFNVSLSNIGSLLRNLVYTIMPVTSADEFEVILTILDSDVSLNFGQSVEGSP